MKPVITINNNILNLACFSIIILILVFGLWPFNLNPANQVFWLPNGPGVRISGPGHLYTAGDPASAFFSGRQISLELLLRPAAEPNNRLPVIVCLGDGRRQEVFLIGQWKDSPAVRVRTSRPDVSRGYRERGKSRVLLNGRPVLLTLASSGAGTGLYVNGEKAAYWPGFPLLEDGPTGSSALVLGNTAIGNSPWKGEITGLALFNRALSDGEVRDRQIAWLRRDYPALQKDPGLIGLYPFTEGKGDRAFNLAPAGPPLIKPAVFHPLQKVVLEWPTKEQWKRRGLYQDLIINVLGFIPLGFFFTLWLLRLNSLSATRVSLLTLSIGTLISLAIELTQVYIPGRDSQASDVVCNVLGTAAGVALTRWKDGMLKYWNNGIMKGRLTAKA